MGKKLAIDFNSQTPIFQQIVNEVERQILIGTLKEEDFLMSVREFAIANTINPNTVAKAYQILQTMDLVESVRGKGLKVKRLKEKTAAARRDDIIAERIKDLLQLGDSLKINAEDIIELIKSIGRKK